MRHLSREFRKTITLACLMDIHIEVMAVIDSPQRVSMGNSVGNLIPSHASSLASALPRINPTCRRAVGATFALIQPGTFHSEHTRRGGCAGQRILEKLRSKP